MTPLHIAFIMDGNGRWAERRHLPRKYGHKMGTETLENTVQSAAELGIKYVTFYAFSTENWSRPQAEIDYLFETFRTFLKKTQKYKKQNYRVRFIGNLSKFPQDIEESCKEMMESTEKNTGLTVVIAMNYGSWEEIVSATNRLIASGKQSVTQEDLVNELYTKDIPFPDMIVRTGGEVRLSNFLMLQAAYSELLFVDTLWPDFDKKALASVVEEYSGRVRKYGGLEEGNAQA